MSLDFSLLGKKEETLYSGNITGNLVPMWYVAHVYDALYESGDKTAKDILPILKSGLKMMLKNPDKFKKLNPDNGWGDYETAVEFLEEVITACEKNPNGVIHLFL